MHDRPPQCSSIAIVSMVLLLAVGWAVYQYIDYLTHHGYGCAICH